MTRDGNLRCAQPKMPQSQRDEQGTVANTQAGTRNTAGNNSPAERNTFTKNTIKGCVAVTHGDHTVTGKSKNFQVAFRLPALLHHMRSIHGVKNISSFHLLHCELYSELDNLIAMECLCNSAKGSDDAYYVSVSLTGYEPNFMPSVSSTTLQVPSLTLSRHRTRTWMT